jgi:hypothetical protein
MQYRNSLFSILLLLTITGFTIENNAKNTGVKRWVVSQNSSLSVNGSTNINKFSCVIPAYDQQDTLIVAANKEDQSVVLTGRIRLSVNSFDCHISAMTRQLRETLKEKQFPALYIRFLSLNRLPVATAMPERITGLVDIEIAGITKRFDVNYRLSGDAQQVIHLQGERIVNFSDFNLVPPTKLGGMIKTKDELNVDFQLNMKALN